jgi:hypothetical protein
MRIARFILPFLFVRNWHDGQWEFSKARCMLSCMALFFIILGLILVYFLQAPVTYTAPHI